MSPFNIFGFPGSKLFGSGPFEVPFFSNTMSAGQPAMMRDPALGAPMQMPLQGQYPAANVPVPTPVSVLSGASDPAGGLLAEPDMYPAGGMSYPPTRQGPTIASVTGQPEPEMSYGRPAPMAGLLTDKPESPVAEKMTTAEKFKQLGGMVSKAGAAPAQGQMLAPPSVGGGGRGFDVTPFLRRGIRVAKR